MCPDHPTPRPSRASHRRAPAGGGRRGFLRLGGALVLGFLMVASSWTGRATSVNASWNVNTETNVVGYRLYYGYGSRQYQLTNLVSGRETSSAVIDIPVADTVYYFALTAVDDVGRESDFSPEVTFTNGPPGEGVTVVSTNLVLATDEDISLQLSLPIEGDPENASGAVAEAPAHGTLRGPLTAPEYVPLTNYHGPDAFQLVLRDGPDRIVKIGVSVEVRSQPDPPVAYDLEYLARTAEGVDVDLVAVDPDEGELVFLARSAPQHGRLDWTPPRVRYTADPGFVGTDEFSYVASNGSLESAEAKVVLRVRKANLAPVAGTNAVVVTAGMPNLLQLPGADPEGGAVYFEIMERPKHGSLEGSPPEFVFRADAGYTGPDRLGYRVADAEGTMGMGQIDLHVRGSPGAAGFGVTLWPSGHMVLTWVAGPGGRYVVSQRWGLEEGSPWQAVALIALEPGATDVFWGIDAINGPPILFFHLEQVGP